MAAGTAQILQKTVCDRFRRDIWGIYSLFW